MIRGYHIYKDIWPAPIGENLRCERESFNPADPYAVATLRGEVVVGHVPRIISAACSAFLRRGGVISCEVTGARQYSADLSQGGMEVPCKLIFTAPSKEIDKLHKLLCRADFKETNSLTNNLSKLDTAVSPAIVINPASTMATDNLYVKPKPSTLDVNPEPSTLDVNPEPSTLDVKPEPSKLDVKLEPTDVPSDNEPLKKKSQIDSSSDSSVAKEIWLKSGKNILTWGDRDTLCNGMQLNDHHINYYQCLLKRQFPSVGGLLLTLLQNSSLKKDRIICGIQIIFCKERNHWVVAARIGSCHNSINVYDSLYKSIDKDTKQAILNIKKVGRVKINSVNMQTQRGGTDCGVFAIAIATSLGYGDDPAKLTFQQENLREHLLKCLEAGNLTVFPVAT